MENPTASILEKLNQRLSEQSQRRSEIHAQFLQYRRESLAQLAALFEAQAGAAPQPFAARARPLESARPAPLFSTAQMAEFASGSMAACFGPEFGLYENRRHPRIPNGDLMLMSRALSITGRRGQLNQPASIVTEYDVPPDAWFFRDNSAPFIPYSVWMEIALQPCGFLSAFLGTPLMFPEIDYYFRNLDGAATLLSNMDLRGRTITCHAQLLSTLAGGETIIQRFTFTLTCGEQKLFEGWSIFGFFPPEAMAAQAGLDGGKSTGPSAADSPDALPLDLPALSRSAPTQPAYRLPTGQLRFLDRLAWLPRSSARAEDILVAERDNDPAAWFYACHFKHDPVMPGSLGVEAILQAIQAYAIAAGLGSGMRSPLFNLPLHQPLSWKYRGQILPTQRQMKLEVRKLRIEPQAGGILVAGDASLWADSMRIYEIKNAALLLADR